MSCSQVHLRGGGFRGERRVDAGRVPLPLQVPRLYRRLLQQPSTFFCREGKVNKVMLKAEMQLLCQAE